MNSINEDMCTTRTHTAAHHPAGEGREGDHELGIPIEQKIVLGRDVNSTSANLSEQTHGGDMSCIISGVGRIPVLPLLGGGR